MKRIILLVTAIVLFSTLNSCKKDENGNIIIASMSAKIAANDWSATVRTCTKTGNTMILTGTSLDGKTIEIKISPDGNESLATNVEYTISIGSFYKPTVSATTADIYFALTGKIKLTQLDMVNKLVSGTFNFDGSSTNFNLITISNGNFSNVSFVGA